MAQENVLWLEIAVNDLLGVQQYETAQDLLCEAANELERKSLEIMGLDELVKIHAQKFSRYAQMTAEIETLSEIDHAVTAMRIPFLELLQKIHLNESLLVESFLVPDDFDRDEAAGFVINTSHDLSETSLAQNINHLISICKVIADNNVVIAPIVIVAEIGGLSIEVAHMFLGMLRTTEVDVLEVDDFAPFKDVQARHSESLPGVHTLLRHSLAAELIQLLCGVLKVFASTSELSHLLVGQPDIRILDRIGRSRVRPSIRLRRIDDLVNGREDRRRRALMRGVTLPGLVGGAWLQGEALITADTGLS